MNEASRQRMSSHDASYALRDALALPATVGLFDVTLNGFELDRFGHDVSNTVSLPTSLASASEKRRREFLAGRYCAAHALRQVGHPSPVDLPIGEDRLPVWPSEWMGSISHSSVGAVAVACRRSSCLALGIDMEQWIGTQIADDIRRQVALPGELERLHDYSPQQALTLLFSAKEALYKALYPLVRKFFEFNAAHLFSVSEQQLEFELREHWGGPWQQGSVLSVRYACLPKHVYTVLHLQHTAGCAADTRHG